LGWLAALAVKERQPNDCDVRIAMTPADLLDWLDGYEMVHVCDACRAVARQPMLHRWQWPDDRIDEQAWSGSHDVGLTGILGLATEMGMAPSSIVLWGLELPDVEESDQRRSELLEQLVFQAAERIVGELRSLDTAVSDTASSARRVDS
jgi:Ni,Fe-hydrogenase maturation factor